MTTTVDPQKTLNAPFILQKSLPGIYGCALGDSITANGKLSDGSNFGYVNNGYTTFARCLSKGGYNLPLNNILGFPGNDSGQILANVGQVIALAPAFCIVHCGTNDSGHSLSVAQSLSNIQAIYNALTSRGISVIAVPILPRAYASGNGATVAAKNQQQQINYGIRQMSRTMRGVYLADPTRNIVDYSQTGNTAGDPLGGAGQAATAMMYDNVGLHPAIRAAYWMGQEIANVLNLLFPPQDVDWQSPVDAFDATNNPGGNLLANGVFAGSGAATSPATGNIATSWSNLGTGTVALSKSTKVFDNPDSSVPTQHMVFGASQTIRLYQQLFSPSGVSVGDWVQGEVVIDLKNPTNLLNIQLQVNDGTHFGYDIQTGASPFYFPTFADSVVRTMVLRTAPIQLTSVSAISWFLDFGTDSGGSLTCDVYKAALRRVAGANVG